MRRRLRFFSTACKRLKSILSRRFVFLTWVEALGNQILSIVNFTVARKSPNVRKAKAEQLISQGWDQGQRGQYEAALQSYKQAVTICHELGDRLREIRALTNIGGIYKDQGRYFEALQLRQQALAFFREIDDCKGEVVTLLNIGAIYRSLGQPLQALESYQQGLALLRAFDERTEEWSLNERRTLEWALLGSMGNAYLCLGQGLQSLKYYQQALVLVKKVSDPKAEGRVLTSIGMLCDALKQYPQALAFYQEALFLREDRANADILHNIGSVYISLGQYSQAEEFLLRALDIHAHLGDRPGIGQVLEDLGRTFLHRGNKAEAEQALRAAIEVNESIQSDLKIEELKASLVDEHISAYKRLIDLLWQEGYFEEAFNYAERSRARAFLDQFANGPINFRTGVSNQLLQQEETLKAQISAYRAQLTQLLTQERSLQHQITALRTQLVNLRSHPGHQLDTEAIASVQKQLIALEKDYTNLLTELKLQSPEAASLVSVDVASLEEIQSLLDADTTLLEYFVTGKRTLAFIITRDHFQTATLNISREDLTKKIEAFRRFASLKNPLPKNLQQLYEWLIVPLKPYLKTPQLAIVPHGVLHYLPFAALTDGNSYLCDDYTITTLPSASSLRFLPQKRKPSTGTLLALGNPTTTEPLPPLHFAEQEVNAIASLYNTEPLIGAAATESTVFSQAGNAEILHLAVHGEFNKHNPLFSTLYLAADAEHDGRLEVHDIYTLDLTTATNLVALSACQTQLGELSQGDEVIGLNRAFLYAGTPSVIATLWSVNDKVTGILMERFYTHLRSGMAKAQALRQAQMEVRVEYPHPYYWAAFVLTGDGR
jgi:CHAT domain-containing protein/Tfp pilus assembly protein PilF